MSGATSTGSGMSSILGSMYSSYALGSLSSAEFSQLAIDTSFIFSDVEIDRDYIRGKELERASTVHL